MKLRVNSIAELLQKFKSFRVYVQLLQGSILRCDPCDFMTQKLLALAPSGTQSSLVHRNSYLYRFCNHHDRFTTSLKHNERGVTITNCQLKEVIKRALKERLRRVMRAWLVDAYNRMKSFPGVEEVQSRKDLLSFLLALAGLTSEFDFHNTERYLYQIVGVLTSQPSIPTHDSNADCVVHLMLASIQDTSYNSTTYGIVLMK